MSHIHSVSERFRQAILYPHVSLSKVEMHTIDGGYIGELDISDGYVNVDEDDTIRRRIRIETADPNMVPDRSSGYLHFLSGTVLWAYKGIKYDDGEIEWVPIGRFMVSKTLVDDSREGFNMNVTAFDMSRTIQRARFFTSYKTAGAVPYIEAIRSVIESKVGWVEFDFSEVEARPELAAILTPAAGLTFGGSGDTGGGNPWDAARDMAEAIACEIFFDIHGKCVVRPIPTFETETPVATFSDGHLHTSSYNVRSIDDEEAYNVVVVHGERPTDETPIVAVVKDENPNSPTWIEGPMGEVPTFIQSRYITSMEQAIAIGTAKLAQRGRNLEDIRLTTVPNYALQEGNAVVVKRDLSKIDGVYIIKNMTLAMSAQQPMWLTMRPKEIF